MTKLLLLHYDALPAPGDPGKARRDRIAEFAANGWSVAIATEYRKYSSWHNAASRWYLTSPHIKLIAVGQDENIVMLVRPDGSYCLSKDEPMPTALGVAIAAMCRAHPDASRCLYVGTKHEHALACEIPGLGIDYIHIGGWHEADAARL